MLSSIPAESTMVSGTGSGTGDPAASEKIVSGAASSNITEFAEDQQEDNR